jgi:hypothetical protein
VSRRPALTLEQLKVYYRGVLFATIAMKGRLARLGPEHRPAVEEVSHYQEMVRRYQQAIDETIELEEREREPA